MSFSNFSQGFASGVTIRGVPLIQTHPGRVFWVGNSATRLTNEKTKSDTANKGGFFDPFSTLDYAIGQCKANRGDIIFVKPNHTETVSSATAINLDVAGIAIVGLGSGLGRPTITLDTATTATLPVSAANITMSNLVISANFGDIVSAFTVTAKDFTLHNCLIKATATNMNFLHVIDTNTTDNSADGLTVTGCFWNEPDAATLAFALVDCKNDRWDISENLMVTGNATADTAALFTIATGKDLTGLKVLRNNIDVTGNAASTAGLLITGDGTAGTGIIAYNNLKHLDATTEILITATHTWGLFENRATAVANAQGYLLPAVDA